MALPPRFGIVLETLESSSGAASLSERLERLASSQRTVAGLLVRCSLYIRAGVAKTEGPGAAQLAEATNVVHIEIGTGAGQEDFYLVNKAIIRAGPELMSVMASKIKLYEQRLSTSVKDHKVYRLGDFEVIVGRLFVRDNMRNFFVEIRCLACGTYEQAAPLVDELLEVLGLSVKVTIPDFAAIKGISDGSRADAAAKRAAYAYLGAVKLL